MERYRAMLKNPPLAMLGSSFYERNRLGPTVYGPPSKHSQGVRYALRPLANVKPRYAQFADSP